MRTLTKAKITIPFREIARITSNQAKEKLNICYKAYVEFKCQAGKKRKNWHLELANERALLEDETRRDCSQNLKNKASNQQLQSI